MVKKTSRDGRNNMTDVFPFTYVIRAI